jgi:FixJ family two-component response regulator
MMPQMSGPDFHGALSLSVPEQAAHLAFITGGAFSATTTEYVSRTGVRVLEKPFEAETLRAVVRELVRASRGG